MRMVLLQTPSDGQNWVRDMYLRFPALREMSEVLTPTKPVGSIRLRLPWGEERSFLVPGAAPLNPWFDVTANDIDRASARDVIDRAFRDAHSRGIGVVGIDYGSEEISVRHVKYADFRDGGDD